MSRWESSIPLSVQGAHPKKILSSRRVNMFCKDLSLTVFLLGEIRTSNGIAQSSIVFCHMYVCGFDQEY